ncbi:MAG: hypothetical protein SOY32_06965 [Candidatus Faecousia sp.]|nr:hypothetical protein [Bacillota bacterium]MDY4220143.1 hypothetical protein [Candidatus Faecousia sp.]
MVTVQPRPESIVSMLFSSAQTDHDGKLYSPAKQGLEFALQRAARNSRAFRVLLLHNSLLLLTSQKSRMRRFVKSEE